MTKRTWLLALLMSCSNKRTMEFLDLLQLLAAGDHGFIFTTFDELINSHLRKGATHRMGRLLSEKLDELDNDKSKLPPKLIAKAIEEFVEGHLQTHGLADVKQVFIANLPPNPELAPAICQTFSKIDIVYALANVHKSLDHDQTAMMATMSCFEEKGFFPIELSAATSLREQTLTMLRYIEIGGSMQIEWIDACESSSHPVARLFEAHVQGASSRTPQPTPAKSSPKTESTGKFPLGAVIAATVTA